MKILLSRIPYSVCAYVALFFICIATPLSAQQSQQPDKQKKQKESAASKFAQGNWLISTIESDNREEGLTKVGKVINTLMNNNIIPQAFDRNYEGKFLIISQKSPPAIRTKQWNFQAYPSEEEMLKDIKTQIQKEGLVPTALDVQQDAAFVLSLVSPDIITAFRLIKVTSTKELVRSIGAYQELGFIPIAMSSFTNSIWIMYAKYPAIPADSMDIIIKAPALEQVPTILDNVLAEKNTQVLAATTTSEGKMILVFLAPAKATVPTQAPTTKTTP